MSEFTEEPPSEDGFRRATALVQSIIATRATRNERLERSDFQDAVQELGRSLANSTSPQVRLEAASLLGKASETFNSKAVTATIGRLIDNGLKIQLPPLGDWGDADDRYYLAKGLHSSVQDWIADYAAAALARAEINEQRSRDVWADLAINRTGDLSKAVEAIAQALASHLSEQDDPSLLAYRKLVRICQALMQTLLTADVPTGRGFGRAFGRLIAQAGGGKGTGHQKAREEAATGVLDLLVQILRLRFDALFDSDLYRAAGAVRGWWRPARPPSEIEAKADRLARLAMGGLHILTRQDVFDSELRQTLARALDPSRINAIGKELASTDSSLTARQSAWLTSGQAPAATRTNETLQEINEQAMDELVARLLLAVQGKDANSRAIQLVAETIELFEPAHAVTLRSAAARFELVEQWAQSLGTKRRLSVSGRPEEIVDFDPAVHESHSTIQRSGRVRIVTPAVIRVLDGRAPAIILKAIVQKL